MILKDENDVFKLLKENEQVPHNIEHGRKDNAELEALIEGKGFKELLIKRIEFIEDSKKSEARQKYSRSIKDFNQRLLRPTDNVYSATGGSKNYIELSDKKRAELLKKISKIRDNRTLQSWLEVNWMDKVYHTDPMGVIFMEYVTGVTEDCWPTYKNINSIRNYKSNGQNLEWIIFEPIKVKDFEKKYDVALNKEGEVYRVVDDEMDYRILKDGDSFITLKDFTFKHPFGKCPGLINSNMKLLIDDIYVSPINGVQELEKEYLRDQSIKTIFKFQRGFPKFARYRMVCPECRGFGKRGNEKCSSCNGIGYIKDSDVTDEIVVPVPDSPNDVVLSPDNIAAYIQPPIETWDQLTKELETLEVLASDAHWGSHKSKVQSSGEKTAFEVWMNSQPVISRLKKYSSVAEFMEWQITEWVANFKFPEKDKDKKIAQINYGRNYIIQPTEFIFEGYKESKDLSIVIRDRQLIEYITSKNRFNPEQLDIELKKMKVEPFPHYTVEQVNTIFGQEFAQAKMLFDRWWNEQDRDIIVKSDVEPLKTGFEAWLKTIKTEPIKIEEND